MIQFLAPLGAYLSSLTGASAAAPAAGASLGSGAAATGLGATGAGAGAGTATSLGVGAGAGAGAVGAGAGATGAGAGTTSGALTAADLAAIKSATAAGSKMTTADMAKNAALGAGAGGIVQEMAAKDTYGQPLQTPKSPDVGAELMKMMQQMGPIAAQQMLRGR